MTSWLLDANVISELRKPRPEPKVMALIAEQPLDRIFLSALTLVEIRFSVRQADAGGKPWTVERCRSHQDGGVARLSAPGGLVKAVASGRPLLLATNSA